MPVDNQQSQIFGRRKMDKCPYNAVDTTKLEHRLDSIEKDHEELKASHDDSVKMVKEIHEYVLNQKASVFGFKIGFKAAFVLLAAIVAGVVAVLTGKFSLKDIFSLF